MKKKIVRSPFFYVGDKYKLIEEISSYFPDDIEKFVEPFVGGGSVFMNIDARKFYLNDIDVNVIALHKFLCKSANKRTEFFSRIESLIAEYGLSYSYKEDRIPVELKRQYKKTYYAKYNKEAYYKMRSDFNNDKDDMMLLYMLLIYGFNRMLRFNSKGDFNLPVGNVDFNKNVVNALNSYFDCVSDKDIELFNMDFQDFIEKVQPSPNDMVYLDPPYLITFSEYNKLWNEDSEMRLIDYLDTLNERGVRFAVSNVLWHRKRYNGTFNEWAQKYNVVKIKSNYISFNDNTEKDTYEVLVKNY